MARSYQVSAFGTQVPYRELYKVITSSTYTVVPEDTNDILIFSQGANATINLPSALAVEGMTFKVWNSNSGTFTVTIDPQGAELIDGVATLVLDVGEGARCYAIGGRWITDRVNSADVFSAAVVAGSAKNSVIRYTGGTSTQGAFDGSAGNPTGTTRLNYGGYFYATRFYGEAGFLTFTSPLLSNPTITNYTETNFAATVTGNAITLALTNGTYQTITTMAGSNTITLPTVTSNAGKSITVQLNYASSPTAIVWAAATGSIKWPGGTTPLPTLTNAKTDFFSFICDGTAWYGIQGGANY